MVIGRTEGHDYFGWSVDPDTIYAAGMVRNIKANETKKVGLFQLRLFNGKKLPGNVTEEFGSYLAIVQPEFMEFTDNQEQYPFVMVAEEGDWNVSTSVTPPEGFIPDLPALEVSAPNGTDHGHAVHRHGHRQRVDGNDRESHHQAPRRDALAHREGVDVRQEGDPRQARRAQGDARQRARPSSM